MGEHQLKSYFIGIACATIYVCNNEFSGIIYSLLSGRQNIFLTIFSTKFVVKCAILKID